MGFIDAYQRMSLEELRKEVIGLLKQAYADGRIGVEALERRLKDATTAKLKDELLALISDIPAPDNGESEDFRDEPRHWRINDGVPKESQTLFAVMGGSERTGRWQPARQISCLSLMGGIKLDFRDAEFPRKGVRINAACIMGGLEIVLPSGINTDVSGLPLMGGFEDKSDDGVTGAPTLTVRGMSLMGGVEIKTKEPKNPSGRKKRSRS